MYTASHLLLLLASIRRAGKACNTFHSFAVHVQVSIFELENPFTAFVSLVKPGKTTGCLTLAGNGRDDLD